jgi:hypothetical protein
VTSYAIFRLHSLWLARLNRAVFFSACLIIPNACGQVTQNCMLPTQPNYDKWLQLTLALVLS